MRLFPHVTAHWYAAHASRRVRSGATTAALMATLAVTACAHGARSTSTPLNRVPVELTVDNKSAIDITVYVMHDGRRDRLDRIEGARKKIVMIPSRMIGVLGDVRLLGEREGARADFGGRIATQQVTVQECQRLEWTIEARLEHSTLGVFLQSECGRDRGT